jgi:hypothetical protein
MTDEQVRTGELAASGEPVGSEATAGAEATPGAEATLAGIVESARRLGVELDEAEAAAWVAALAGEQAGGDLVVDVDTGIYGHRVSMLDFTPGDVARFRAIGKVVGFEDRPPEFLTALALSGSAAQSRVQAYPGDCDFFERIHITAPTREEACAILAREMRAKALATRTGKGWRLWEVKLGSYPFDGVHNGWDVKTGKPISWTPVEVERGDITILRDGAPVTLTWDEAALDPGWCKLDWIVTDPVRLGLANASNVLDVTWEAPDGTITPLDGFVDPYFQEVYLEAESLPLFQKLVKELSADSVEEYVAALQHEVVKYASPGHANWGKVARRLYNIFRLTGYYPEAVYLRELFDEPTTILYQVAAQIRTLNDADQPGGDFDLDVMVRQTDDLIMAAIQALEGQSEVEMVRRLLAVRDNLQARRGAAGRTADVDDVTARALAAVNEYFERRLFEVPSIKAYVDELVARAA